jgi:DNA-binding response OmpR family regulator
MDFLGCINMKKVLLIDDEPALLNIYAEFLELGGFTVKTVQNSSEALPIMDKEEFNILITDLEMPNVHGLDIISGVRKNNKEIIIIAFSGGGRSGLCDNLSVAERLGADCSMRKPFMGSELVNNVNELVELKE